ncbi:MAG: anion permease, partial [Gemmatimonadales bacterium]|nr:anion permease [Gemmatimonadales bacterium]
MSDRPTAGPPVLPTARPPVHPSARARAGAVLAPAVFVLLLALPIGTLPASAHRLAAVLGAVVVLWVTEALPLAVTALLGAAICVLLGVA